LEGFTFTSTRKIPLPSNFSRTSCTIFSSLIISAILSNKRGDSVPSHNLFLYSAANIRDISFICKYRPVHNIILNVAESPTSCRIFAMNRSLRGMNVFARRKNLNCWLSITYASFLWRARSSIPVSPPERQIGKN
jgi:hypothetical protein